MKEIKRIFWKYKIQIFLVLCLILGISWFTFHTDIFSVAKTTSRVANGDFSMTYKNPDTGEIAYSSFFPPLCHFIDALFYYPFLKLGVYNFDFNNIPREQLLSVGFLLKLRYLMAFVLSILIIIGVSKSYEKDEKQRNKIFLLWLLCPSLLYLVSSWGNIDIYPVFLLLLFLLFSFKKKYFLAMVFLGLSAATKNFSLFLVLPAALILSNKNWKKTIFYGFCSILIYMIPWFLYRNVIGVSAITSGGEGLFILGRNILGGPLFFPLVYFLTILFLLVKQKVSDFNKNEILVKYCFLIISFFYLTSFYMPNWFLWIIPFFVLTAYKNRKLFYLYLLISITFFIGILTWNGNLDTTLFSTAFPVITKITTLYGFVAKHFSAFKIFDIIFSLFFAAFGCYLYLLFFDKDKVLSKEELSEKEINIFSLSPLFLYLIICFVFVFGMVVVRNQKNKDWYDLGLLSRGEVIGQIYNSGQFYQTFKSPNNNLKGINLFLSTYTKKIITPYKLVLYDEACKNKILESEIEVAKIDDNAYREVLFNEVKDSKDKEYCFTVEPTIKQIDTPITLHYSKYDSYSLGELTVNNNKLKNEDVVFQLIYPLR